MSLLGSRAGRMAAAVLAGIALVTGIMVAVLWRGGVERSFS